MTAPNLNEFAFVRILADFEAPVEVIEGIDVVFQKNQIYFLPFACMK